MKKYYLVFYILLFSFLSFQFVYALSPLTAFAGPVLGMISCVNGMMFFVLNYRTAPGSLIPLFIIESFMMYPWSLLISGSLAPNIFLSGLAYPTGVCLIECPGAGLCPIPTNWSVFYVGAAISLIGL